MRTALDRQGPEQPKTPELYPALAATEPLVLALQRTAGNHAVGRMLSRRVQDRPSAHPQIQLGSSDAAEVTILQTRLNEDGADPAVAVTGTFDAATRTAVLAFQGRHGLKVDGIVGIRTWGVLDELERRGIAGPQQTVLDDVQPVTQEDHDAIEAILHPGHSGGAPGPAMTDHEPGGAYETQVLDALDRLHAATVSALVATPAVDMNHAARVSTAAQEEVERFFGSTIALASRKPTGEWHPGSSFMGLADATTRPMGTGDIIGWTDYFMDNGSYEPAQIAAGFHFDSTRATPDRRAHDRVRNLWLNTRDGRRKAREMARAWPAEASTGTVFLQLRDPGYQDRVGMWDLFMTLVHEFMHLVTHPNYGNAADLIGGGARDVLIEGMDEHMSQQVWPVVRDRAAGDPALRTIVEGPFFSATPDPAEYADGADIDRRVKAHVYDSMTDADAIAAQVGEANVRAAFFMGHVEAIGIGAGTASETPLGRIGTWTPGGGGTPDTYVVPPAGETLQQVRDRTNATTVSDAAGTEQTDPAHAFAGGETLTIPGVRWHVGIAEDTRGQVATQHGISQAALERANGLAPDRPQTLVGAGTLLLIPLP